MTMFDAYLSFRACCPVLDSRAPGVGRGTTMTSCRRGQLMHARINMLAGDPAMLSEATRYLEGTVRPHVEGQHGNRGLACLVNADTRDLRRRVLLGQRRRDDRERAGRPGLPQGDRRAAARRSVTVEHYEVPVFVRRSRPAEGAGARLARVDCAPGNIDAFIEEFRTTRRPGPDGHERAVQRAPDDRPDQRAVHCRHRVAGPRRPRCEPRGHRAAARRRRRRYARAGPRRRGVRRSCSPRCATATPAVAHRAGDRALERP